MDQPIKSLIAKRPQLFSSERKSPHWKFIRNLEQKQIGQSKKFFDSDRFQHFKSSEPAKWHRGIQRLANHLKPQVTIKCHRFIIIYYIAVSEK